MEPGACNVPPRTWSKTSTTFSLVPHTKHFFHKAPVLVPRAQAKVLDSTSQMWPQVTSPRLGEEALVIPEVTPHSPVLSLQDQKCTL